LIVAVTVEIAINPLGLGAGIMLASRRCADLMLAYLVWIGAIATRWNILLVVAQQRLFAAPPERRPALNHHPILWRTASFCGCGPALLRSGNWSPI